MSSAKSHDSRLSFTRDRNRVATSPSITRWSHDIEMFTIERTAMASSITTGRLVIASKDRMPAFGEVGDRTRDADRVHPVGALDNGHDEAGVVRDSDAHVDVPMEDDALAVQPSVHVGVLEQRVDGRAHDERQVREVRAVLLPEGILRPLSDLDQMIDVHLDQGPRPR